MLVTSIQGLMVTQQIDFLDTICLLLVAPCVFAPKQQTCAGRAGMVVKWSVYAFGDW